MGAARPFRQPVKCGAGRIASSVSATPVTAREGTMERRDGRTLAYAERGPADGAPVIFHHGLRGVGPGPWRTGFRTQPSSWFPAKGTCFTTPGATRWHGPWRDRGPAVRKVAAAVAARARLGADDRGRGRSRPRFRS